MMYKSLCLLLISVMLILSPCRAYCAIDWLYQGMMLGSAAVVSNPWAIGAAVLAAGVGAYIGAKYNPVGKALAWAKGSFWQNIVSWYDKLSTKAKADLDAAGQEYLATGQISMTYDLREAARLLSPLELPFDLPGQVGWYESAQAYEFTYESVAEIIAASFMSITYVGSNSRFYFCPYRWYPASYGSLRYDVYEVQGEYNFRRIGLGSNYSIGWRGGGSSGRYVTTVTDLDGVSLSLPVGDMITTADVTAISVHNAIENLIRWKYTNTETWIETNPDYTLHKDYVFREPVIYTPTYGEVITSNIPVSVTDQGKYDIGIDVATTETTGIGIEGEPAIPDTPDYSGILGSILGLLQTLAQSIANAISAVFVGDWASVDFSPLELAFENVSTRFPFSIPWDFQRVVGVFAVPVVSEVPSWTLTMPGGIWGNSELVIAFPVMFEKFWGFIRWGMIVVWDLGLISWSSQWFGAGDK